MKKVIVDLLIVGVMLGLFWLLLSNFHSDVTSITKSYGPVFMLDTTKYYAIRYGFEAVLVTIGTIFLLYAVKEIK
jgi:hypothetical protein